MHVGMAVLSDCLHVQDRGMDKADAVRCKRTNVRRIGQINRIGSHPHMHFMAVFLMRKFFIR